MDHLCEENPDDIMSSSDHPQKNFFVEWIYIVDLDNLVLHVDERPLFRLDHLPPPDIFVHSIGIDHYYEKLRIAITHSSNTVTTGPLPFTPCTIGLTAYRYHVSENSIRPIHEMLSISEDLPRAEQSCTEILEIMVGSHMANGENAKTIHGLENVPSRGLMPLETTNRAFDLLTLAP
jgi:hypothetical protein